MKTIHFLIKKVLKMYLDDVLLNTDIYLKKAHCSKVPAIR